jgi:hypothetical protein
MTLPLPFSKRMTSAACVFTCIFIASPQGAQTFAFGNGTIIGALQLEYSQLLHEYRRLRHQDVANQAIMLADVINDAVATVESLQATVDSIPATFQNEFMLQGMQIVVANCLINLKAAQVDEA